MKMNATASQTTADYISSFSASTQATLQTLQAAIRRAAPGAHEKMSYGIPTFVLEGNLVHFGAYRNHIGFYPGASAVAAFQHDLAPFKTAKGTVQFAIGQPLPLELIERMVQYRVRQNLETAAWKESAKKIKRK